MLELWCEAVPARRDGILAALYADPEDDEDAHLDNVAHVLSTGGEVAYD